METPRVLQTPGEPVAEPLGTVARNAFHLVLGQIASTIMAIAFSAVLGRSLGAHGYGLYYLITTLSMFAFVIVEWGQPLLLIRFIATDKARSGELLGTALVMRIAFTLLALAPVGMAAWALGYGVHAVWLSVLYMLASLPLSLTQAYGMIFRGHDRMGSDATVAVVGKAILLAVIVPALGLGAGLPGVVVAQAVAGVAALALAHHAFRRVGTHRLRCSRSTVRLILKGGAPILAMTAAMSAQPYIDALILSRLAPGNVVGWFGAARNILGTIMAPATILGVAAYPRLARAFTEPFPALRREATSALRTIFILGCLAATGTYLFASTAVGLVYGTAGFGPAATVLKVFSPGLLLVFIDIVLGTIVYACGGATGFAIAKILSVAASAGLDLLLIPVFQARFGNGGIGAVVAFGASEVIVFAGALLVVPRGALSAMDLLDLLRALAAGGATILLFRVLGDITPFLAIPLCVVVFLVASLSMGLIRRSDVAEIARRIRAWLASRVRGSRAPRTPPADVGPAPRGTARSATVKPPAEPRPVETCVLQFPESETGGER